MAPRLTAEALKEHEATLRFEKLSKAEESLRGVIAELRVLITWLNAKIVRGCQEISGLPECVQLEMVPEPARPQDLVKIIDIGKGQTALNAILSDLKGRAIWEVLELLNEVHVEITKGLVIGLKWQTGQPDDLAMLKLKYHGKLKELELENRLSLCIETAQKLLFTMKRIITSFEHRWEEPLKRLGGLAGKKAEDITKTLQQTFDDVFTMKSWREQSLEEVTQKVLPAFQLLYTQEFAGVPEWRSNLKVLTSRLQSLI